MSEACVAICKHCKAHILGHHAPIFCPKCMKRL